MFMSRGEVNLSARGGLRGVEIDVYLLIREEALPPLDELTTNPGASLPPPRGSRRPVAAPPPRPGALGR